MQKNYSWIYILTNQLNTTLYIGVTSNLQKRIYEHKNDKRSGFSNKYRLNKLVYFELFEDIKAAIDREKQLKNWHRKWKMNLIISKNPRFYDLAYDDGSLNNSIGDRYVRDPEINSGGRVG